MRNIPFGMPIIGNEEKEAVLKVLSGNVLVHGPKAHEFEHAFSEFTGAPYSVSCSSATAALHLSYFNLGIGAGDEVIVPAQTHNATAHAVEFTGAKPVFVDAERETGNININLIEEAITPRTKAISIVHFLGMPVDMDGVMAIAKKHNLFVVEDCALSPGGYYKGVHTGLHGDVGCFSFYPVKHFTTSEGGMLITKSKEIAEKISRQKAFGVDRTHHERKVAGVYDVTMLGFNYRMSEIEAVIGIEQLKRLPGFLEKRKENFDCLFAELSDIEEISLLKSSHGDFQSSYYCLSFVLNEQLTSQRFELTKFLNENGVGTSVYYPRPVPHFTYYREKYGYTENSFPVASWISYSSVALPVAPHLNTEDMKYISDKVKQAIRLVK